METRWMRLALEEARLALSRGEAPVGCVVVRNGEAIARAGNRREELRDPAAHAEMLAISQAARAIGDWRLADCELFVTLEPCPMCAGAISQARLRRLVFGAEDTRQGCAGSVYRIPEDPAFSHFCKIEGGVLREECAQLLDDFFRRQRAVEKK